MNFQDLVEGFSLCGNKQTNGISHKIYEFVSKSTKVQSEFVGTYYIQLENKAFVRKSI